MLSSLDREGEVLIAFLTRPEVYLDIGDMSLVSDVSAFGTN